MYQGNNNNWLTFYPNHESYRAKGPSPLPEDASKLLPGTNILGGTSSEDRWEPRLSSSGSVSLSGLCLIALWRILKYEICLSNVSSP